MALLRKVLGFVLVVAVVFFVSVLVYLKYQGKALMERKVSAVFQKPVSVGSVTYRFPLGVDVTGLNIEGLLFAADARVAGDLDLLAANRWGFKEVVLNDAVLTIHRSEDNTIDWHSHPSTGSEAAPAAGPRSNPYKGMIKKLVVTQGKIIFPSHQADDPINISLAEMQLTAFNIPLTSQDGPVPFAMSGRILDGEAFSGPNQFTAEGWVNWHKRDLVADGKITKFKDRMDVILEARSQSNQLTVSGRMKSLAQKAQNVPGSSAQDVLSVIFEEAGMTVDLNFSFTTLMDRWELRKIDFSGNLSPSVSEENK